MSHHTRHTWKKYLQSWKHQIPDVQFMSKSGYSNNVQMKKSQHSETPWSSAKCQTRTPMWLQEEGSAKTNSSVCFPDDYCCDSPNVLKSEDRAWREKVKSNLKTRAQQRLDNMRLCNPEATLFRNWNLCTKIENVVCVANCGIKFICHHCETLVQRSGSERFESSWTILYIFQKTKADYSPFF